MKTREEVEAAVPVAGLHLEQTPRGHWCVKQSSRNVVLVECQDKEQAARAAAELGGIARWQTPVDLLNQAYYQTFESGGSALYENIRRIQQTYQRPAEVREERRAAPPVRKKTHAAEAGFVAAESAAAGRWNVVHAASGRIVGWTGNAKAAEHAADELRRHAGRGADSMDALLAEETGMQDYVAAVAEAAENGENWPPVPEMLSFRLMFWQHPRLKDRWPAFQEAWLELEGMVGLGNVKEQMRRMVKQLKGQMRTNRADKKRRNSLHMVFAGAPGTGKTQTAGIIGRLLHAIGAVENADMIVASASDLIGSALGETENKTTELLERAMGGGLLIDEAYLLADGEGARGFGQKAVGLLVDAMDKRNQDFFVILAGYPEEMKELVAMNKGLASRVRYVEFEAYTLEELSAIAEKMLAAEGLAWGREEEQAWQAALKEQMTGGVLSGNGRDVRSLIDDILEAYDIRMGEDLDAPVGRLRTEDIKNARKKQGPQNKQAGLAAVREEALADLRAMAGMEHVTRQAEMWFSRLLLEQEKFNRGMAAEKPRLHMVFEGPSGTGKSTVAEIMARFLKGAGLLSKGTFQKATRASLVGRWQGHSAKKTREKVESSVGGVLLIEEAYSLVLGRDGQDTFGHESLTELVDLMEVHKHDLAVILAGYPGPMKELMNRNEGLESRIAQRFTLEDYDARAMAAIVRGKLKAGGMIVTAETAEWLERTIEEEALKRGGTFKGNGRWAESWVSAMKNAQAMRLSAQDFADLTDEEMLLITREDMMCALTAMP